MAWYESQPDSLGQPFINLITGSDLAGKITIPINWYDMYYLGGAKTMSMENWST